jgi:hypothetical protein
MTVRKEIIEFRELTHETQYIVNHVFNAQDFDVHSNNVSLKCSSYFYSKSSMMQQSISVFKSRKTKEKKTSLDE